VVEDGKLQLHKLSFSNSSLTDVNFTSRRANHYWDISTIVDMYPDQQTSSNKWIASYLIFIFLIPNDVVFS